MVETVDCGSRKEEHVRLCSLNFKNTLLNSIFERIGRLISERIGQKQLLPFMDVLSL